MNIFRWVWLKIPIIGVRRAKIYKMARQNTPYGNVLTGKAWGVYKGQAGFFGGRLTYIGGKHGWVPDGRITGRKRCGIYFENYRQALLNCRLLSDGVMSGRKGVKS